MQHRARKRFGQNFLVDDRVAEQIVAAIAPCAEQRILDAIATGNPSPTDGRAGLAVVRVLEAAQRSIRKEGERIYLTEER